MIKLLASIVIMGIAGASYAVELNGSSVKERKDRIAAEGAVSGGADSANDGSDGGSAKPLKWVSIIVGKFKMGTDGGEKHFENAGPVHEVVVNNFDMSEAPVTVAQYAECVGGGGCTEPGTGGLCNWGKPGRENHPVNCVDWNQAQKYAKFQGGRLPSEAEWEYAARSRGDSRKYPWGDDEPTGALAVFNTNSTMPVCSRPEGNTDQGLCDMAGNVWQWVQDKYQDSYKDAPKDGSAFERAGSRRVIRGGSFLNDDVRVLRSDFRGRDGPGYRSPNIGFRVAR